MISEWPLGEKNVGERAQSTVDTVQEKIDVDQIQDQVAKLRDQIEGVLGTWKESFSPAAPSKEPNKVITKKTAPKTKATAKATTTKKAAPTKKTTTKTSASKKAATAKK